MNKLVATLVVSMVVVPFAAAPADAAKAKPAKAAKKEAAPPVADQEEMNKLRGDFKWGMSPDQVAAEIAKRIEAANADKLKATANDPTKQDRLRKQMRAEIEGVKKKVVKFEGAKTGYDVSIIDQEFSHGTNESMLLVKEDNGTRYFFFADDKLYKMFIAFDKDILKDKSFTDFGALMQARFGKAKEVYVDEKQKAGVRHRLDHYVWASKVGDGLRLVDRSEFYDVYCLVIFDGAVAARLDDARKFAKTGGEKKDSLVEAVIQKSDNDNDPNDNVVDRIVGKQARRPGDGQNESIVVPSPAAQGVRAPTADEVNRKDSASSKSAPSGEKKAAKSGLEL